jgi:hypothetical protein
MKKILLASLLCVFSWQAQAANIVVNGSFENPDIKAGSWTKF